MCVPWDSQENETMQFLFLLLLALTFHQKLKYDFGGMQNKKPFEIILPVDRVTSFQSWVAKKSCHSEILTNVCSIFDCPSNFERL